MTPMEKAQAPIAVALTGASGTQYGLRLLECLLQAERTVYLMVSQAAQVVVNMETDLQLPGRPDEIRACLAERYAARPGQLQVFGRQQWTAPVASGSNPPEAVVVCPCTTGTLASVANGICDNLIDRAADVALKERRKLILVVRETPFSTIHLENMLRLAQAGAVIMPANPGFYQGAETIAKMKSMNAGQTGFSTSEIGDLRKDIVHSGDTVNTAARIEALCRPLGHKLLVSAALLERLPEGMGLHLQDLGRVPLRGKEIEVHLYSVLGPRPERVERAPSPGTRPSAGLSHKKSHGGGPV